MKVRCYIVENCYEFIDTLERELCREGISYVRIDKELHFLDQIIKFLDFDLDKDLIVQMGLSQMQLELTEEINIVASKDFDELKGFKLESITYQQQNKKSLKNQSNIVNQKLKKYKKKISTKL